MNNVVVSSLNKTFHAFRNLRLGAYPRQTLYGIRMVRQYTADVDHETNQGDAYACYIYATQSQMSRSTPDTGDVTVFGLRRHTTSARLLTP